MLSDHPSLGRLSESFSLKHPTVNVFYGFLDCHLHMDSPFKIDKYFYTGQKNYPTLKSGSDYKLQSEKAASN